MAAAVADATVGFARLEHIPKVVHTLSIMVADSCEHILTVCWVVAVSGIGAAPKLQVQTVVLTTGFAMMSLLLPLNPLPVLPLLELQTSQWISLRTADLHGAGPRESGGQIPPGIGVIALGREQQPATPVAPEEGGGQGTRLPLQGPEGHDLTVRPVGDQIAPGHGR